MIKLAEISKSFHSFPGIWTNDKSEDLSFLILMVVPNRSHYPHSGLFRPLRDSRKKNISARNARVAEAFSIQWYATGDSAVVNRLSRNWTHLFGSTAFLLVTLHEVPCKKLWSKPKPQGLLLHILEGCVRDRRAHFEVNQSLFSTTLSGAYLVWSLRLPSQRYIWGLQITEHTALILWTLAFHKVHCSLLILSVLIILS